MPRLNRLLSSAGLLFVGFGACHPDATAAYQATARQWLFETPAAAADGQVTPVEGTIGGETRPAVRLTANTSVSYRLVRGGQLRFAAAVEGPDAAATGLGLEVDVARGPDPKVTRLTSLARIPHDRWYPVTAERTLAAGDELTFRVPASAKADTSAAVLLADPVVQSPTTGVEPTLVVVVLIDTIRADHTSLLGYTRPTTPSLETLGRDSVTFLRAHVTAPWTRPSVASLLTSLDPDEHGVLLGVDRLRDEIVTWPEIARQQGFQTVAVSTNPNMLPVFGLPQGFGRFIDLDSQRFWLPASGAPKVFAAAERLLHEEQLPLFLYLHLMDPHFPYDPPVATARQLFPGYTASSPGRTVDPEDPDDVIQAAVRRYDAEIRYADAALGAFLNTLHQRGLYDRALIIVVGDHGEEFKDHGGVYHGATLYEEQLHVPLVIKFPRGWSGGTRVSSLVSITDVLPTVAETVGWPIPPGISGSSVRGAITGRGPGREAITAFTQFEDVQAYAIIRNGHKLIRQVRPRPTTQLFDLRADPAEQRPESDEARRSELLHMLETRLARRQGGWHVRLCGGATAGRVVLEVEGVAQPIGSADLEAADRLEAGTGNGRVRFEGQVGPVKRHKVGFGTVEDTVVRDGDEIWFPATRPTLRLEPFAGEATPQIRLGADQKAVSDHVVELDPVRWRTAPSQAPECLPLPQPTVLVWYVAPPPPTEKAQPDPATRERLRALGYAVE